MTLAGVTPPESTPGDPSREPAARSHPRPPGPRSRFGLRELFGFTRNPLRLLRRLRAEYGDVVELRMAGMTWFLLSHPEDIEFVLVKNAKKMKRDATVPILERTLGLGLLTSEGELWKRQRKLMAQAFTPKRIATYAETMSAVTDRAVDFAHGQEIDLHAEMSRVTMEVVAAVLFGAAMGQGDIGQVSASMEVVNEFYANSPEAVLRVPAWVPTPRNRSLARAVGRLDALIYRMIAERRRGEPRDDLLGTLLAAVDDEGSAMTDRQLRDESITLFLAGHETTALTLGYSLMLLAQHPEIARRLHDEVDAVLDGRLPTAEDCKRLTFTEQVLKESMRLYPPAWTTGREATESIEVRGYTIPKGSQLLLSQWVTHHDARFFPNPETFDPDRWTTAQDLPRYAFFPFGGGPRVCIGNHFAMMEAIVVLAILVQRFRFDLVPCQRLQLRPSVTLRPKRGMRAIVRRV